MSLLYDASLGIAEASGGLEVCLGGAKTEI